MLNRSTMRYAQLSCYASRLLGFGDWEGEKIWRSLSLWDLVRDRTRTKKSGF